MPRKEIDYSKTVIYKIVCNNLNVKDVYVGHTTGFTKRKASHKGVLNCPNHHSYNLKVYTTIRDNGGWENWTMIEIEKYPCNDKNEACSRERHFYELLNANMNIQCPTLDIEKGKKYRKVYMKKYVEDHKDDMKEYMKKYHADYDKAYYQANKERYLEKKACDVCGKLYINKTNHNKTKFHNNAIKK